MNENSDLVRRGALAPRPFPAGRNGIEQSLALSIRDEILTR
jgi:hypothetical protein